MKNIFVLIFVTCAQSAIAQLYAPGATVTGTSNSATNNVGIGTSTPLTTLHLTSGGSTFIRMDKASGSEGGLQFNVGNTTKFYFWSDNSDNDALKISAAGLTGETDATPRMMFPSDNKNIYMAQSGGYVGLGTNNPSALFHISGTGSPWTTVAWSKAIEIPNVSVLKWSSNSVGQRFGIGQTDNGLSFIRSSADDNSGVGTYDVFVSNNGKVGIGNNTPSAKLHIAGQGGSWTTSAWNKAIEIPDVSVLKWASNAQGWRFGIGQTATGLLFVRTNADDDSAAPIYDMCFTNNGNVGIGTSTPGSFKLAVNGKIWTQEVNVQMNNPGPDYVFEKDYNLLPLMEVESYIKANKHLPEVPSAKEMEEDGLNLKEMNLILLKKVEELTLHAIDANKKMEQLERRNEQLEQKLASLEQQVKK